MWRKIRDPIWIIWCFTESRWSGISRKSPSQVKAIESAPWYIIIIINIIIYNYKIPDNLTIYNGEQQRM